MAKPSAAESLPTITRKIVFAQPPAGGPGPTSAFAALRPRCLPPLPVPSCPRFSPASCTRSRPAPPTVSAQLPVSANCRLGPASRPLPATRAFLHPGLFLSCCLASMELHGERVSGPTASSSSGDRSQVTVSRELLNAGSAGSRGERRRRDRWAGGPGVPPGPGRSGGRGTVESGLQGPGMPRRPGRSGWGDRECSRRRVCGDAAEPGTLCGRGCLGDRECLGRRGCCGALDAEGDWGHCGARDSVGGGGHAEESRTLWGLGCPRRWGC